MLIDALADMDDYVTATSWMDGAFCVEADPEAWFPEHGAPAGPAKRICAACPARAACLAYALAEDIPYGIYGGLTPQERQHLQQLDLAV
ncbi:WhiB family transcriptional regulator [Nonomuraea sp. NPDC050227]|uniref:WhiB family transcriptional regulator n=1 Tax=Nonomuraea sp. NPDC050227 TaxID=3364360 RepID=UPI0037B4812A